MCLAFLAQSPRLASNSSIFLTLLAGYPCFLITIGSPTSSCRLLASLHGRGARCTAQFPERRGCGLRAPEERAGPLDILVPIVVQPFAVETARQRPYLPQTIVHGSEPVLGVPQLILQACQCGPTSARSSRLGCDRRRPTAFCSGASAPSATSAPCKDRCDLGNGGGRHLSRVVLTRVPFRLQKAQISCSIDHRLSRKNRK